MNVWRYIERQRLSRQELGWVVERKGEKEGGRERERERAAEYINAW